MAKTHIDLKCNHQLVENVSATLVTPKWFTPTHSRSLVKVS